MSTELLPRQETKLSDWAKTQEARDQIAAAIGGEMNPDQFITHMLVAFQDPQVRRCSVRSQIVAFMECAALSLLPTLNEVRLIPYKDEIKAMPQWQGLKNLMERHPSVLEVQAFLVHPTDTFACDEGTFKHHYNPFNPDRIFNTAEDLVGGYARIVYRDGRPPKYHFVTRQQIEKAQKCAQTQNVWRSWYEQMALKTVYRDCYARRAVPMDPLVYHRLEQCVKLDDVILGNDPILIDNESAQAVAAKLTQQAKSAFPEPETPQEQSEPERRIPSDPAEEEAPPQQEESLEQQVANYVMLVEQAAKVKDVNEYLMKMPKEFVGDDRMKIVSACQLRIEAIKSK